MTSYLSLHLLVCCALRSILSDELNRVTLENYSNRYIIFESIHQLNKVCVLLHIRRVLKVRVKAFILSLKFSNIVSQYITLLTVHFKHFGYRNYFFLFVFFFFIFVVVVFFSNLFAIAAVIMWNDMSVSNRLASLCASVAACLKSIVNVCKTLLFKIQLRLALFTPVMFFSTFFLVFFSFVKCDQLISRSNAWHRNQSNKNVNVIFNYTCIFSLLTSKWHMTNTDICAQNQSIELKWIFRFHLLFDSLHIKLHTMF